jgi:hypothetical protein
LNKFITKFKDIVDLQITQFENNFIQNKKQNTKKNSGVRVFCVMLCIHHRLSFFFLAIVLSVLLQFTDSDYPLISSNFSYLSSTSTDCLHSRNGLLYCVWNITESDVKHKKIKIKSNLNTTGHSVVISSLTFYFLIV